MRRDLCRTMESRDSGLRLSPTEYSTRCGPGEGGEADPVRAGYFITATTDTYQPE